MGQRVLLTVDRDLSRPHSDLRHECTHDLLPLGLGAADEAITHDFCVLPDSRRCNSESIGLGAVGLDPRSDVEIARKQGFSFDPVVAKSEPPPSVSNAIVAPIDLAELAGSRFIREIEDLLTPTFEATAGG